jgi:outer membrane protein assembly factor BamB
MRYALALALAALLGEGARGEDWPEFRGPTGQGHARAAGLPLAWSPTRNITWKQAIPGSGWSSPVVVQGRIYLTSAVPTRDDSGDLELRALCLNAKSGKVLWSTKVFHQAAAAAPRIHGKNSHASPTPLVSGERVYVHFGHQGTACLDLDGKVKWSNNTIKYAPVHGAGGSPVLAGDALIFSCDGARRPFVVALDRNSGKELWRTDRSERADRTFSFSTPLLITVKGKKQLVSPGSDMVAAYDPANGKEIWKVRYEGYSVIPRPVYGHGLVFLSTGYEAPSVLAIKADGSGDVTDTHVKWRLKPGAPHTPSPLLVGDELFLLSDRGFASCVDARSGKLRWRKRLGGGYSASPLYANGRIYCTSEAGLTTVFKAGKKYVLLARSDLRERTLASLAVADGALFLRTARHLYRFGPKEKVPRRKDER